MVFRRPELFPVAGRSWAFSVPFRTLPRHDMSMIKDAAALQRTVGWDREIATSPKERENLHNYLTLQLASAGLEPPEASTVQDSLGAFSGEMLESLRQKNRLLTGYRAPIDSRIETFLNRYFGDLTDGDPVRLPGRSLTLDRHGMARELSLPVDGDHFKNELIESYRCENGILNNPRADRRTTAGTFHVVDGGLPIPGDKRSDAVAVHVPGKETRLHVGVVVAAALGLSGSPRRLFGQVDRDAFLCARVV